MLNKIAVFDSGVGGLGTLKLLEKNALAKEIIYYADNANMPFGNKSKAEIIKIGQNAIDFLSKENVDCIILACNTVSSVLKELKSDMKILPIIDFAIKGLSDIKNNQNTLVIATKATINSGIYQHFCQNFNIKADFISPISFVPIVESMDFKKSKDYFLEYFPKNNYDYILYACTHYPFLENELKDYFKNSIMIDPAIILTQTLCKEHNKRANSVSISFKASKDVKALKIFYERIKNE